MNPFDKYQGISLNGQWWDKSELIGQPFEKVHSDNHNEALIFAASLFDETERITVSTSGSTGAPKKISFPKSAFAISATNTNQYFGLVRNSQTALALPMTYIAGRMMVVRALVGQYNLDVLAPSSQAFSGDKTYDFAPVTPFQMEEILKSNQHFRIKKFLIGGGQIGSDLKTRILQNGLAAYASFGMTETLSHFALSKLTKSEDMWYTLIDSVQVKSATNDYLQIKYPGITDGWLRTGDLVEIKGNQFRWLGRSDFLINSGGVKLIPEEIEAQLSNMISIPYFVFGVPHPTLGEAATLFIEGSETEILLDTIQWKKPFQRPKECIFIPAFTRTESGKIKRKDTVNSWLAERRN